MNNASMKYNHCYKKNCVILVYQVQVIPMCLGTTVTDGKDRRCDRQRTLVPFPLPCGAHTMATMAFCSDVTHLKLSR